MCRTISSPRDRGAANRDAERPAPNAWAHGTGRPRRLLSMRLPEGQAWSAWDGCLEDWGSERQGYGTCRVGLPARNACPLESVALPHTRPEGDEVAAITGQGGSLGCADGSARCAPSPMCAVHSAGMMLLTASFCVCSCVARSSAVVVVHPGAGRRVAHRLIGLPHAAPRWATSKQGQWMSRCGGRPRIPAPAARIPPKGDTPARFVDLPEHVCAESKSGIGTSTLWRV